MNGTSMFTRAMAIGLVGVLGATSAQAAFPDAFTTPPPGWTGPAFHLSQDYPKTRPAAGAHPWTSINFKTTAGAPQYMKAVLDYCVQGNTSATMEDNFADVGHNAVRKWYHAPWLHATASGREFIHGMTKERPSKMGPPPELGPAQTGPHDNWAVGMYNPRGGYTLGQVWKDPMHPDPRKGKFPAHTVSCKYIFTTTPASEAPFLQGSLLEWHADTNRSNSTSLSSRPTVRLLQVDIAVKDSRANSTIGWVFGTFQYEAGVNNSPNWWEHLVPVGLMWGNDPVHTLARQPSTEQWINPARDPQLHLGFNGLLDGPIDNPLASCTGCHSRAQINRVNGPIPSLPSPPSNDHPSDTVVKNYFTNLKAATALSGDYASVDYSLQLQLGIRRAIEEPGSGVSLPASFGTATTVVHAAHPTHLPVATHIVSVTRDD